LVIEEESKLVPLRKKLSRHLCEGERLIDRCCLKNRDTHPLRIHRPERSAKGSPQGRLAKHMAGRRPSSNLPSRPTPTRRDGRRRRFFVSIALGLFLLEGGLRVLLGNFGHSKVLERAEDKEICLQLKANAQEIYTGWRAQVGASHMIINDYGIRGPEFDLAREAGVFRVVVLGDSFTFGQGVNYPQSYPALLQAELEEAGIETEVLNFGVPGHSTPQSLAFAKARVTPLKPDLVLLSVFANDLSAAESYCHYGQGGSALGAWVLRNIYVGRLAYLLASPLIFKEVTQDDYPGLGSPDERFVQSIDELQTLAEEEGFLTAVVLLTDRSMFLEDRFCSGCTPAHDLVGQSRIKVFNLGPLWQSLQADIPTNFIIGEDHFTPTGNAQVANKISDELRQWTEFQQSVDRVGAVGP